MAKWSITHVVEEDGVRFYLVESAILRSSTKVPIEKWGECGSDSEIAGLAQLLAWQDEDFTITDEESLLVPHHKIAELSDSAADALSLPASTPFLLNLQHSGTLDQPEFKFRASWLQTTGQRLLGASRTGSILTVGSKTYRVPHAVHQLLEATKAFNDASGQGDDARLYHWSIVQELLPESSTRSINADGYIQSTRIAHAAAFSLDLKSGSDGFTFDPVLFGPKIADRAVSAPTDDEIVEGISESQQLLPDAQHEVFTQKRFNQFDDCKGRYALGDGWYVVFDPETQQALSTVRKLQRADRDTRREFVKNPRAFIRKELGDKFVEAQLERLFVETAEYSQRVRDVGLWEPVVLPWVARSNDSWIPDKFGIKVGETYITIEPAQVSDLKKTAQEAVQAGRTSFEWGGELIPASDETLQAIQSLVGFEKPEAIDTPPTEPTGDGVEPPPGPIVLVIDQNLDEVEYTRTINRRADDVDDHQPVSLKATLKQHQVEGLQWLKEAWVSGSSGVLLADDMGLGKTLQALAFLAWLRERMDNRQLTRAPILMVAPVGLLKNWREEHAIHFHLPGLGNELIAYGKDLQALRTKSGREIDAGEALLDSHELQRADWVLTTYETLRDYQHSFGAIRFAAIVYDEVQKIKTPGTIMTRAAKAMNGDFVLALTGTPVENRLADLWCIMDTLQPGALGGLKEFSSRYENEPEEADLRQLKDQLMQPVNGTPASMLRRMKAGSLQGLPEKNEYPIKKEMPAAQAQLYSEAIARAANSSKKGAMLKALQEFKSISLHPTHPDMADGSNYIQESARLSATFEVLDQIQQKGEKALIFLESREMQPVVASLIQRHYKLPRQPMLINGAVAGAKRQDRVNEFQKAPKGFDVIILSPRAGGVGLTLTAANHVIHLSRWWNPAVEDQCTDRVYRIGQNKNVHVYYPMAIHPAFADTSFDQRLHNLLERKRSLSREMLMPPVDASADAANLFKQTIGDQNYDEKEPAHGSTSMSLDEIDVMEPLQFEDWILNALGTKGFEVSRTPSSHDHGADGIAVSRTTGKRVIVQCKHTQPGNLANEIAVEDLMRARKAYPLQDATCIAITNAKGYTSRAIKLANENGIRLVDRGSLAQWPSQVGG